MTLAPRPRFRRLKIALVSVLATFAVVEAGWRVYLFHFASEYQWRKATRPEDVPVEQRRYQSHPYTIYGLRPGYVSRDGRSRHGARGFRGAEIEVPKPAGEVRIVCLGGSTTYDTSIDDDRRTYPARLEALLREKYGHDEVRVVNGGVPGYSTWETLVHLQMRVLPLEPDLVIVYHATNDVHARLVPPEVYRRDNTGHRHAWREELRWWDRSLFLHKLGVQWGFSQRNDLKSLTMVDYEGGVDAERCLDANRPVYFRQNLEDMLALCRAHGVDLMLTSWAWSPLMDDYAASAHYQRGFREHNEVSRQVAEEHGLLFLDLAARMPTDPEYWADGRHNNEAGAELKAGLVAELLSERYLSRRE